MAQSLPVSSDSGVDIVRKEQEAVLWKHNLESLINLGRKTHRKIKFVTATGFKKSHGPVFVRIYCMLGSLLQWEKESVPSFLYSMACIVSPLSLPRVINFKYPLQHHQKYYITQYHNCEELFIAYSDDSGLYHQFSLMCLFKRLLWEIILSEPPIPGMSLHQRARHWVTLDDNKGEWLPFPYEWSSDRSWHSGDPHGSHFHFPLTHHSEERQE